MKPTTTTPSVEGGSEEEEGIGMGWGEGEVAVEEGGGRMRTRIDDWFGLGGSIPVEGTVVIWFGLFGLPLTERERGYGGYCYYELIEFNFLRSGL